MFTVVVVTITKTWKQCKCPLTDEWIKKMWGVCVCVCVCIMEYYLAIKNILHNATCSNLEIDHTK